MIKFLVKLAIAALIANAAWHLGSAYLTFYRFKDAVNEFAQFNPQKSAAEIEQRVLDLASQYDVPLSADRVSIRRDDQSHTLITGSYTQPVDLAPGYVRPWVFSFDVDVVPVAAAFPAPTR
jgi:hypothetical protein